MPEDIDNMTKVGRALLYLLGGAGVGAAGDYLVRGRVTPWGPLIGGAAGLGTHAAIHPKDYTALADYLGRTSTALGLAGRTPSAAKPGYSINPDAMARAKVGTAEATRIFTNFKIKPEDLANMPKDEQVRILQAGKQIGEEANRTLASSTGEKALNWTGLASGTAAPYVGKVSPVAGKILGSGVGAANISYGVYNQQTDMARKLRERKALGDEEQYLEGGDVSGGAFGKKYMGEAAKLGTGAVADTLKAKLTTMGGLPGALGTAGVDIVGNVAGSLTGQPDAYVPGRTWSNLIDTGRMLPGVAKNMAAGKTGFATTSQRELQKGKGNAYSYGPEFGSEYARLRSQGLKPQEIARQLLGSGAIQNTFVDKPKERAEVHNAPQEYDKETFAQILKEVREANPEMSPGQAANEAYRFMDQTGQADSGLRKSWTKI